MEFLDLLQSAFDNTAFRRVLFTGEYCQLAVMDIKPEEGMEDEQLENDKIFLVLRGHGEITFTEGGGLLKEGSCMFVAEETKYKLINNGDQELKLVVIYAPATFSDDTVEGTALDAAVDI